VVAQTIGATVCSFCELYNVPQMKPAETSAHFVPPQNAFDTQPVERL